MDQSGFEDLSISFDTPGKNKCSWDELEISSPNGSSGHQESVTVTPNSSFQKLSSKNPFYAFADDENNENKDGGMRKTTGEFVDYIKEFQEGESKENVESRPKLSMSSRKPVVPRSPRVFGHNFKYIKGFIQSSNENRAKIYLEASSDEARKKLSEEKKPQSIEERYNLLKKDLKLASRRITELKSANETIQKRKEELQREVLNAQRHITGVEVERDELKNRATELAVELRVAKQRIAEAENEANISIGRATKLARELEKSEAKREKYREELNSAEKRTYDLETNLRAAQQNRRSENDERNEVMRKLYEVETRESNKSAEIKKLDDNMSYLKDKCDHLHEQVGRAIHEKAHYQGQKQELEKLNFALKDDLEQLQAKYQSSQKENELSNERLHALREKFDSMIHSTMKLETELSVMHDELAKQRLEKKKLSDDYRSVLKQFGDGKLVMERCDKERSTLKKENRGMKDKLAYLELYKRVIESNRYILEDGRKRYLRTNNMDTVKVHKERKDDGKDDNNTFRSISNIQRDDSFSSNHMRQRLEKKTEEYSFPRILIGGDKQTANYSDLLHGNTDLANAML